MKRALAISAALVAGTMAVPAAASAATHTLKFTAKANQVTTAQSVLLNRQANIDRLQISGHGIDFEILPGSGHCVAYGFYRGTVVRITDCDHAGHRQPRFSVRAYAMGNARRVVITYS